MGGISLCSNLSSCCHPFKGGSEIKNGAALSPNSKCVLVTLTISAIAGTVFTILGAISIFGPVGSAGFVGSVVLGGLVILLSGASIVRLLKNQVNPQALS